MNAVQSIIGGGIAGCMATIPMSVTMEFLHRRLPSLQQYPLPPRQVTMQVADAAGVLGTLDEDDRENASLIAHFGMGTAMGTIYGVLGKHLPIDGPVAGSAVGMAVWAGNYLGLLPALGLLTPATRHPAQRTALMIAAHVVWGAAAGMLLQSLKRPDKDCL